MNIKILPLPKGGKNRAGAGVFSSIGKFSRPFLKQILRIGLNKLKEKAMDKIKKEERILLDWLPCNNNNNNN